MTQLFTNFKASYNSHLQRASKATGIPVDVVAAQWANESDYGRSPRAKYDNNLGGIKYSKYSKTAKKAADGVHAKYNTVFDFVTDYIRVMGLSYYADVRTAGKTPGIEDDLKELGESPYAGSKYKLRANAAPGSALAAIVGKEKGATVCPTCRRPL